MTSTSMPVTGIDALGRQIQTLTAELQRARHSNNEDLDTQHQLLDALDDLRAEIVGPVEWPRTFFAPQEFAAMQVAFEREIFQNVPLAPGASIHARDLAALVKMDEDFLLRIMRCLAANKMFVEANEKVFAHTPISAAQTDEHVAVRTAGELYDLNKASSSLTEAIDKFEGLVKAADERFEVDRVYYGKNYFAVVSVKLVQHDLGSAQVPDTSLNDALYGTTNGDSAGVTGNHSDVVEELKAAETDVLAS